ncbi:transketolase family protein [Pectinatus haikarae]|uniref:Transketolase n=1 Tax=Pectinatus haikarae TaxID=349096 RepID=A0ABT9Y967_9FIRM|nr:transketolase C-terminal domain-containing protein [Pectinatus haikarae]MDQ0204383.1 transketolase [Pectinatus haikarae]
MCQYKGTREAFAKAITELADAGNDKLMFISADSLKSMKCTEFAEKYPQRYIEAGIAEQNSVAMAAGLASTGLMPFIATYAGFLTMRACEQIRTFIAYTNLNVKIIGINGGIFSGEKEGVTHQFFEDLAIMRAIPNMKVIVPADDTQMYQAVKASAEIDGPVYIRAGSGREHRVFTESHNFEFGKINVIESYGSDVVLFSTGLLMNRAMEAARRLNDRGIKGTLVDVPTLKPLDSEGITNILRKCGKAVTIEDHNIIGGLADAVALVSTEHYPVHIKRVGLHDIFPSSGAAEEVLDHYGMAIDDIIAAVEELCH